MNISLYNTLKSEKEASINASYARIKGYTDSYNTIYTPKLVKKISNASYFTLKYVSLILGFALIILPALSLIIVLNTSQNPVLQQEKYHDSMITGFAIAFVFFGILSLICFFISFLTNRIIRRNKTIAQFATQMLEVINIEKKHIETEKQSYFNLLDTMQRDMNKHEGNN
jgi:hypothetical protein